MNDSWHSYPKVFAIGHAAIREIFDGPVEVQEKVDGSQFSFNYFGGELRMRSKGAMINIASPEKMFIPAVEYVKSIQDRLFSEWTYSGEYLAKPYHNGIAYDRIPKNHIALFDVRIGYEQYLPYDELVKAGEQIDLEVVPRLYTGLVGSPDVFREMLKTPSFLGGHAIEGVVVKNYRRFGADDRVLMGKFVSEEFKEEQAKVWGERNPNQNDIIERMVAKYSVPARWAKAVQHLREQGKITDSPADLQYIIPEVKKDLLEECKEPIIEEMWEWAAEHIARRSVRQIPAWYKERLLTRAFEKEE